MFRLQNNPSLMPAHFGGDKFDPTYKAAQRATVLTISYEIDRTLFENYIPEEFELLASEAQVAFMQLTEINWLLVGSTT